MQSCQYDEVHVHNFLQLLSITTGLLGNLLCITTGLVCNLFCITTGLVCNLLCITTGLVCNRLCITTGLVYNRLCITTGLVYSTNDQMDYLPSCIPSGCILQMYMYNCVKFLSILVHLFRRSCAYKKYAQTDGPGDSCVPIIRSW